MTLDGRDRAVVHLVARFHQAASAQIHELVFSDLASKTPYDRALRRLAAGNYLARIERRVVGGSRGGSGQYVYQLGRRGYFLHYTGRYNPSRAVNYHSLAVLDSYLIIKRLERAGAVAIAGVSTEPDCWVQIGRTELKPDLHIELAGSSGEKLKLWLEVDMGTEGQRAIKDKLERYWRAFNEADVGLWPVFPRVVFVAVDDERVKELRWFIGQGPRDALPLFAVTTPAGLPGFLAPASS